MSETAKRTPWASRVPAPNIAAQELTALQDTHHLGIHMFEKCPPYTFPQKTVDWFSRVPTAQMREHLLQGTMPRTSFSLLPSSKSPYTMAPFLVDEDNTPMVAYLLDLRQDEACHNPAIILRASPDNLGSGEDDQKGLMLAKTRESGNEYRNLTGIKALDDLYNDTTLFPAEGQHDEMAYIRELAGENHRAHSEMQLQALGQFYCDANTPPHSDMFHSLEDDSHVLLNNEVVGGVTKDHIAAICVPLFTDGKSQWSGFTDGKSQWYGPLCMLSAALAGIQHLSRGIDKPVVLYHVQENTAENEHHNAGQIEYVGRSPRELCDVALTALLDLQQQGGFSSPPTIPDPIYEGTARLKDLRQSVITTMGIDPMEPINIHTAREHIRNHLKSAHNLEVSWR